MGEDIDALKANTAIAQLMILVNALYDEGGATRAEYEVLLQLLNPFVPHMTEELINKMSDTEIVDGARDFRLMSRRMVDAVLEMSEYNRFSKGIFSWVGFKTKWFAYQNVERVAGQTKWNFWSLFKYSIEGIVGFSTQPLVMAALAGVIFCLAAFVGIIFVVVRALIFGDPTAGWPSMVCIMLLCSGVQLFCLGIVGEYLAKTYLEVKHRPIYITRETEQDRDERKPAQQK